MNEIWMCKPIGFVSSPIRLFANEGDARVYADGRNRVVAKVPVFDSLEQMGEHLRLKARAVQWGTVERIEDRDAADVSGAFREQAHEI